MCRKCVATRLAADSGEQEEKVRGFVITRDREG